MKKAFFFDRDGIVNRRLIGDYVKNIDEFQFLEDFFPIFSLASERKYLKILITNQQCIGKKIITEDELQHIHDFMQTELVKRTGEKFDAIYVAPDLASSNSFRRKPAPGMILEAIEKYKISPEESWMLGDAVSDVVAGKAAKTKTILMGDFVDIPEANFIFPSLKDVFDFLKDNLK